MKNKKMIIGVLCLALVFMGIGFALFSTTLNLSGTATASGTFDVKITNVELDTAKKTAGATNTTEVPGANYAVTEQNLSATFSEPGDYITWTLTVTNRGTIEAAITVEVNMLNDANGAYKLVCDVEEGTTLAPSATTTFPCEMSFDKNHELTSQEFAALPKGSPVTMRVMVKAIQKANYVNPNTVEAEKRTQGPWTIEVTDTVSNTEYGTIVKYDFNHPDASTNIVVPYSVDGVVAKSIDGSTFTSYNLIMYLEQSEFNLAGVIVATGDEYTDIYTALSDDSDFITLYNSESDIPSGYEKYGYFDFDPDSFEFNAATNPVSSVNFSQATGLEEIGASLFVGSSLSSVTFGNNSAVKTIGANAFGACQLSGTLSLPASVESIGFGAFYGTENSDNSEETSTNQITSIVFQGNNLKTIGQAAFKGNKITGTLTLPSSLEEIGDYAFWGKEDGTSNSISSIVFQGTALKIISAGAFEDNALTGTLTLPSGLEEIGNFAFAGTENGLTNRITSLVFQGTALKKIGNFAFEDNALTGTLTLPSGLEEIGNSAFYGKNDGTSNQITSIVFQGNNLKTIGISAFANNKLTGTLTLPSGLEEIGSWAFYGCTDGLTNQIASVVFQGTRLKIIGDSSFKDNNITGALTLPSSVEKVENNAFAENSISTLYLGASINTLGYQAFYMSSGSLTNVHVDMTQNEWNSIQSQSLIFNGSPTMHYNQS